jgi:hypothetical protein
VINETNNDLSTFEGGVNTGVSPNVGTIDAAHNGISGGAGGESVPALAFAEFGINASKAFGTEGKCTSFAQVQWESRSSGSSFTSNPQDIETESKTVSNCAEVIMRKVTSPANKDQAFSYTSNLPTTSDNPVTSSSSPYCEGTTNPTSFSLNDKSFTVTGITAASSAVVTTSTANNFVVGQRVTISGSNSTPSLNGDQIVTAVSNGGKSFTVAVTTTAVGTAGSVVGNAEDCNNVLAGNNYTVTEAAQAGYTLTSIDCTASNTGNGSTATGDISTGITTINLKPGDVIDCTYTNTLSTAKLTTQQQATGTVFPGTSVTDIAKVAGSTSTYPDSSKLVSFYLCGPETGLTSCISTDTTIQSLGTGTLSHTLTAGTSTAPSPVVNTSGSVTGVLTAGTYCFGATWPGDATYPGALSDDGTNECFTVSQIGTTTKTTPSPTGGTTTFGDTTVTDHAVVEAVADGGGIPTGTVLFTICSPSQMALLSESSCVTGGTQVGLAVTLGSVDQGKTHPSAAADSSAFTNTVGGVDKGVNQLGTWCWRAEFTPSGTNGNNYTGSHDSSVTECFTVTDTSVSSSAQTWYPNDSASVSATNGESISGTLTIQLYTGDNCGATSGSVVSGQSYTSGDTSGTTITATSGKQTTFGVDTNNAGAFSWKVVFTPDTGSFVSGSTRCEKSNLTITN